MIVIGVSRVRVIFKKGNLNNIRVGGGRMEYGVSGSMKIQREDDRTRGFNINYKLEN